WAIFGPTVPRVHTPISHSQSKPRPAIRSISSSGTVPRVTGLPARFDRSASQGRVNTSYKIGDRVMGLGILGTGRPRMVRWEPPFDGEPSSSGLPFLISFAAILFAAHAADLPD